MIPQPKDQFTPEENLKNALGMLVAIALSGGGNYYAVWEYYTDILLVDEVINPATSVLRDMKDAAQAVKFTKELYFQHVGEKYVESGE